ncbi:MAG: hypothetical protein U0572_06640 [Phycisphaerales bacterium]
MSLLKPITAFAVSFVMLVACAATPGKVSEKELAVIRQDAMQIPPGTPRDATLDKLKPCNTVRLGAGTYGGVAVEEWKAEAFYEHKDGRDLFVRFLYFANGKLADVSDQRIDFRNNPALVKQWSGG